jgi:predicted permease
MPDWRELLRSRLAGLSLSPEREADIVEELSLHLDEHYRELIAGGADESTAAAQALRDLAGHDVLAARLRPLRQTHVVAPLTPGRPERHVLRDAWQDLRYAFRMLRRQPAFTAAAVLTLALGIGANTAIFSLANATLFSRLPVADRASLYYVHNGPVGFAFSYPAYVALRDNSRAFRDVAAWGTITASLNDEGATDLISGAIVSGNLFEVLGVAAERGRPLSAADDARPGAHPVAVISHRLWRTRFHGRDDIVNHTIRLNGRPFTIVGVAPEGFDGPEVGSVRDLYVPMMMQALMRPPRAGFAGEDDPDLLQRAGNQWLLAVARLRPSVDEAAARADAVNVMSAFFRGLSVRESPRSPEEMQTRIAGLALVHVDQGDPRTRQRATSVALLLGSVVGAVLLIACANIANLLLSRAAARRREVALRIAIGASRWRIVRQLLTESLLLSLIGGAVGVALAVGLGRWIAAAPPPPGALPLEIAVAVNWTVLLFSLTLSIVTGLIFGLVPALEASRPALIPSLKDEAVSMDEHGRRISLKKILVVTEVALALALLLAAGLFARSLASAQAIDPGIDVRPLVSARLNINILRYTTAQGRAFYQRVIDDLSALPGVERAALSRMPILDGAVRTTSLAIEGRQADAAAFLSEGRAATAAAPSSIEANVVTPGFFATLGIDVLQGRDLSRADTDGRPPVVVINEASAQFHFAGLASAIGQRLSVDGPDGPWREVVGVVRDSKYASIGEDVLPAVYLPLAQNHETGMTLYVRAAGDAGALAPAIRRVIRDIEPDLPVPSVQTMAEVVSTQLYPARMGAWAVGVFGVLALLLAVIGIYGVLSFAIARRTREMGIRLALGADARDIFMLVLRDGLSLVGIGVALGLSIGIIGARSLSAFLYDIPPTDVTTFAGVTVVLTLAAAVACAVPARRAMRVDPIRAVRADG